MRLCPSSASNRAYVAVSAGSATATAASTIARYSGRAIVEPHEPAVGRDRGSDQRGVGAAAAGELGAFLEGVQRLGCARPVLRIAEANEQVGAFGVGSIERDRHVERDAVVLRCLDRREVLERVVTGARRPEQRFGGQTPKFTVARELHHDIGRHDLVALLQGARGALVQARPPR